jgi:hypothetical protein
MFQRLCIAVDLVRHTSFGYERRGVYSRTSELVIIPTVTLHLLVSSQQTSSHTHTQQTNHTRLQNHITMSNSTIPVTNSVDKTTADVSKDDARNAESAVSGVVPQSKLPAVPQRSFARLDAYPYTNVVVDYRRRGQGLEGLSRWRRDPRQRGRCHHSRCRERRLRPGEEGRQPRPLSVGSTRMNEKG